MIAHSVPQVLLHGLDPYHDHSQQHHIDPFVAQYMDNGSMDHCANYDGIGDDDNVNMNVERLSDNQYDDEGMF